MMAPRARSPSLAKLTPPKLPPVLERPRLFRNLDQARNTKPIIWIAGPPGSGKTTLVASYLRVRKLRCLWYQVDEGDADPATFFHYLGLAVQRAAPHYRQRLPHLTPEYRPGLSTFTRRFFQDLYGRLKPPSAVIFDNYQEASENPQFHEIIEIGLSQIPDGIMAIIVSREPPPPSFATLQAKQALAMLDPDSLRLTDEEARGIVCLHGTSERWRPSTSFLKVMHDKLQGWVAGLVLVLEQVKTSEDQANFSNAETPTVVFEYLAKEVMKGLSQEVRDFLLKTSLLPTITVELAHRLTGLSRANDILQRLYRTRYFTECRFEPAPIYQYHPLFREFLLTQARRSFAPDQFANLRQSAASLLEEANRIEDAIALYQQAGLADHALRLILAHAPLLIAQGRAQTLGQWLHVLPQEIVDQNSWLQFWLGSCRFVSNPAEAQGPFEQAFTLFKGQGDQVGTLLAACGIVESIIFTWRDFRRLDPWINYLATMTLDHLRALPPEVVLRILPGIVMALVWRQPQDPACARWLTYAVELLPQAHDPIQRALLAFHLMGPFTWFGELSQAGHVYQVLKTGFHHGSAPTFARVLFYGTEAVHAWWMGQAELADRAICQAQAVAHESGIRILDDVLETLKVWVHLSAGNVTAAEESLAGQRAFFEHVDEERGGIFHYHMAYLARLRGDLERAWFWLSRALRLQSMMDSPFWKAMWTLAAADVLHARGMHDDARRHFARAREMGRGVPSKLLGFQSLLAEAHFALDRGEEGEALRVLKQGMAVGRAQRLVDTAWWIPPVMARLCDKALEAGIEVEYIQQLIRKRRLIPEDPLLTTERWPWPIKIVTLGRFQVVVDGAPLQFSRKVQKRPLVLLKAIIAFGGREVPEMHLSDALWPEAEGDVAHEAFATTLHRLRKLLRHEQSTQLKDGKVTLDPQHCWVDTWAFEHVLEQAEAAGAAGDSKRRIRLSEQSLNLYEGPFLPEESAEPWTVALRERLSSKYIRHAGHLSRLYEQQRDYERTVACLEKALKAEPTAESFYQDLMLHWSRQGRRAEAQAVYERCRATLAATLGVQPSPETERIGQTC